MVAVAKSKLIKHVKSREKREKALKTALDDYLSSLENADTEHHSIGWFAQKHGIAKETLRRAHKGQRHGHMTKLFKTEEETLVKWIIGLADRACPPDNTKICAMATRILQGRLPDAKLGHNWLQRFKARHHSRIKTSWGSSLDSQRADALNPVTVKKYFEMVANVYEAENIQTDCRWGADESGVWEGISGAQRVTGRAGTKRQHVRQEANREITTVMATICASGQSLAPFVIFRGERFQRSWGLKNPGGAVIARSENGWTDSHLNFAWLQWFEAQTRPVPPERKRALHLDSHKTHITLECDDFAAAAGIILIGYPPKTTHALQGLDRVHFARVKDLWPLAVKKFAADNGHAVGKDNFLEVLHGVWEKVFTPDNNSQAFIITGLTRPVRPEVITTEMMAPSLESSTEHSHSLILTTPVRKAASVMRYVEKMSTEPRLLSDAPTQSPPSTPDGLRSSLLISPTSMRIHPSLFTPTKQARAIAQHALTNNLDLGLGSSTPGPASLLVPSLARCPTIPGSTYHPTGNVFLETVDDFRDENLRLQEALLASQNEANIQRGLIQAQNAQLLVQEEESLGLQRRLQEKEKKKTKSHTAKYLKDGGRRVYTDVAYREALKADEEAALKDRLDKLRRAAVSAAKKERTKWRDRGVKARKARFDKRMKDWDKACKELRAIGTKPPAKPRREAREVTPDYLNDAVQQAEGLDQEALLQLEGLMREEPESARSRAAEDKRQRILAAMKSNDDDEGQGGSDSE